MKSISTVLGLVGLVAANPVPISHVNAAVQPQHGGDFGPFSFTSTFNLIATPDRVVDMEDTLVAGEAGSMGFYNYGINSELDIICYVSTTDTPPYLGIQQLILYHYRTSP